MNINLQSILPKDISDEAAYYIVELFTEISTALEEYYFDSGRQHINNTHSRSPDDSQREIDFGHGDPF